jgi:thiamine-phosphate pyrophosphorylase
LLLYYITDRRQLAGTETEQVEQLLERIEQAACGGVDFIQLRETDLPGGALESLARTAAERIRASASNTCLLINSRTDVALAAGAQGVHLRSKDVSPADVRKIWRRATPQSHPTVAVSCHNEREVVEARSWGADFLVFGPVFEKRQVVGAAVTGLEGLRLACRHNIPVFALGGVTLENAPMALMAGAKGIAGIRLFQLGDMERTLSRLRAQAGN